MTKRYVFDESISHFTDTQTNKEYSEYNLNKVVELLNALNDDNTKLQKEIEQLSKDRWKTSRKAEKLEIENEKLKKELYLREDQIQQLTIAVHTDYYKEAEKYRKKFVRVCNELADDDVECSNLKIENEQLENEVARLELIIHNLKKTTD